MRLVDTLLTLMCDGRKALLNHKRSCLGSGKEGSGEKSHRQLIDCIRSKDTEALIDAIDNCSWFFDINSNNSSSSSISYSSSGSNNKISICNN